LQRVRLCLYGSVASNGPTIQPPDDTKVNAEQHWNDTGRNTKKPGEKPVPVPFCPPYPTWTTLGANLSLYSIKQLTAWAKAQPKQWC
jgi:hypothetical protein